MMAMGLIFRNETFPLFIKKLNIPSFWPERERERKEERGRGRKREENESRFRLTFKL